MLVARDNFDEVGARSGSLARHDVEMRVDMSTFIEIQRQLDASLSKLLTQASIWPSECG